MIIFKKIDNGNVLVVESDGTVKCSYTGCKQILRHPTTPNTMVITDDANPQEDGKGLLVSFDSVDVGNCEPPIVASNINELITALSSSFFFKLKSSSFPLVVVTTPIINLTKDVESYFILKGSYFTESTQVEITGDTIISSVEFINQSELKVSVIGGSSVGNYDLSLMNNGGVKTYSNRINVLSKNWVDLRVGGTPLTIGTLPTDDIIHSAGLTVSRDANGLKQVGANNWDDWIKFNNLQFTRGDNKTIEFIFINNYQTLMLGIGSTQAVQSNVMFSQYESQLYFQTPTKIYGIYGNNGTLGVSKTDILIGVKEANKYYKLKIDKDGSVGSKFQVFELPDGTENSWNDESLLIHENISNLTPNKQTLMPVCLPRFASHLRILAVNIH